MVDPVRRDLLTAERAATMTAEAQASNLELSWSDFQGETLGRLIDAVLEIDSKLSGAHTDR